MQPQKLLDECLLCVPFAEIPRPLSSWTAARAMLTVGLLFIIVFVFFWHTISVFWLTDWSMLSAKATVKHIVGVVVSILCADVALYFLAYYMVRVWWWFRRNVIGTTVYIVLDVEGKCHIHTWRMWKSLNVTMIQLRIGGWFRNNRITGPASVDWKIICAWNWRVSIRDRYGNEITLKVCDGHAYEIGAAPLRTLLAILMYHRSVPEFMVAHHLVSLMQHHGTPAPRRSPSQAIMPMPHRPIRRSA